MTDIMHDITIVVVDLKDGNGLVVEWFRGISGDWGMVNMELKEKYPNSTDFDISLVIHI